MPMDFEDVYTLDVSTDTTNDTPAATYEALRIDGANMMVRGRVMSSAFVPGSGSMTSLTFDFDDAGTTDMDEAYEVAGTYDGGMGMYRCNDTAVCTVTLDDEGMITAMSGWIFTPAEDSMVDVPDPDYLHYGFWLARTKTRTATSRGTARSRPSPTQLLL